MIGYKIASTDNKRVLVTLEIPVDSNTNLNRADIKDKEFAKYRCDKAKVLSIEDNEGNKYVSARSIMYDKKIVEYNVNEEVKEPNYDKDINIVCGEGIHFFLNKEIALFYRLDNVENGELKKWYHNGQLMEECTYKDGKPDGKYKKYYINGQLMEECTYKDGKSDGEYKSWYENGKLSQEATYEDGKIHGKYKMYYENGQLDRKYEKYHKDGQLREECMFVNNEYHGKHRLWNENGKLTQEVFYVKGNLKHVIKC